MPFYRQQKPGIGIDITAACNLRCRFCFLEDDFQGIMDTQRVLDIIAQAKGNFQELYLLGGEPTLHPELPAILRAGLEFFPVVILVTNGIKLADENYFEEVALPGLHISMRRHVMGDNKEERALEDYICQRIGACEQVSKAWHNIEQGWTHKNVCAQCNILKPLLQQGHIASVFRWAREQGFEPIMEFTKPGPRFIRGNELDVSVVEIGKLYQELRCIDAQYQSASDLPDKLCPPVYDHVCTLIEVGAHVTIDGRVIPCVGHHNLIYGNVFEQSLDEILSHPLRVAISNYKNWIVGPCRDCELFDFCHGGCRGEAFWDTGCPRASDPYCWHHNPNLTLKDMTPISCKGCILENNPGCNIRV